MLLNYLKIAFRTLLRQKLNSMVNLAGLSLGLACALLILFHVKEELSFDKGFIHSDRIYRVTQQGLGEDARHWAATPPPMAPQIGQYFPEIAATVRFYRPYPFQVLSHTTARGAVNRFEEKGGFFADSSAVDVFDLRFLAGNPRTALNEPGAIVLTEAMAVKYFGADWIRHNPIGKTIQDDMQKQPLKVTGILRPFGFRTHLQFDYLISMASISRYLDQPSLENRSWSGFYTYILLKDGTSRQAIERKMNDFMVNFYLATGETREEILAGRRLPLQPITDIHLHSKLEKEMHPNSDITYVYIFSMAALLILLIAAVNFINISTAQAFNRMKEVGVRKVMGAQKGQLIRQFVGESFLLTCLSALIALGLFHLAIPFYNDLTARDLRFEHLLTLPNLALLFLLLGLIGLLAGIYPAWFVANFNPISSLKGKKDNASSVHLVRKSLIVFQFVVSVFMIFSTVIIYQQMRYFHQRDLGFDKDQVVAVKVYGDMWENFGAILQEVRSQTAISSYATLSTLPGERFSMQSFTPIGASQNANRPSTRAMWADEKTLPTLQIPLKEGRNFHNQFPDIKKNEFILNETAVKTFLPGADSPIGKKVILDTDTGEVVGVVKDFNFASLHAQIEPLVIEYQPYRANYLLLKVKGTDLSGTLHFLETKIRALSPSSQFSYSFLDENLNRLYESENRMSQVFQAFSCFAIFISCLGLFGLSAYSAQLRTKEIGIRKVLGATTGQLVTLLSKDFVQLVVWGILIAWPLAAWAMSQWLSNFAYRIPITPWVFLLSGFSALLVALFTVGFQAIKSSLSNPVKSLRTE